jgi:hypothetical protein
VCPLGLAKNGFVFFLEYRVVLILVWLKMYKRHEPLLPHSHGLNLISETDLCYWIFKIDKSVCIVQKLDDFGLHCESPSKD